LSPFSFLEIENNYFSDNKEFLYERDKGFICVPILKKEKTKVSKIIQQKDLLNEINTKRGKR